MLGLALTPPPVATRAALLRGTRNIGFVIGLLAGGAGLAGSLATHMLTLFTLGCAVGVGLVAAIAGRTSPRPHPGLAVRRVHGAVLRARHRADRRPGPAWAAFGVLGVGAGLLILESALPRLGLPQYRAEAMTVEWSGYGSAVIAGALAFDSPAQLAALLAAFGAVLGPGGRATGPGRPPAADDLLDWRSASSSSAGACS